MVGLQLDAGQLGDAVDEARHLAAEMTFDFFGSGCGVLDHVVQQRRDH